MFGKCGTRDPGFCGSVSPETQRKKTFKHKYGENGKFGKISFYKITLMKNL
jgi:hypothetical protein